MKHRFLLLLTMVAFLQTNLFAEHVSAEKASQVGMNFMKQKHTYITTRGETLKMYKSVELTQVTNRSVSNQHFYVFNLNDNQGWVMVADDDRCIPILGYSKSGEFVTENLPSNIEDWLVGISSEIQYAIDNDIVPDESTMLLWKELFAGVSTEFINRGEKVVNPLVQTRWNQAPYYNALCPYDNHYGERTVTGCVATAMAQVLKYWNHPEVGSGSHSYSTSSYGTLYANFGGAQYDWNNMPNRVTSANNAVATLMYHCGVSVDMSYGVSATGGSGAYVISSYSNTEHCAEYAFKNHFGYKSSAHGELKNNMSDSQWKSLMRADLDASRPLVYAGFGNGGHCFICDGYDNSDKFHFNWGWDGQNDGFFSLSSLNPGSGGAGGGSYSFTNNQQAIFGLEPNNGGGGGGGGGGSSSNANLRLYSALSVESQIWFGSEISVTASIGNWGNTTFNGSFCAAAFDADGNFIDFIDIKSCSLQSGYYYNFEFSTTDNMVFVPGQYQVALFYKTSNEDWTIVDNGNYNNYGTFEIYYYDDIETYSDFTILSNNGRLVQGSTARVKVDVANTGNSDFYGNLRVNLSTLNGEWVQNIEVKSMSSGLSSGYYYSLTFEGAITAEPGTYHMELAYYDNGWYYAGAYYSSNPITVVVEAQEINADQYEANNTQSQAYKLVPSNWTNNQTTLYTTGSNLHVGNDIDYYKIELPTGRNYTINARLHDSYDSGNGHDYTVDAMFAYSTDGQNYSAGIDDVMDETITMSGGTVYFYVTPYFSGMSGTYLLDIQINRSGSIGIDEEYANNLVLYPNPVKDLLHVRCDNMRQYYIFSVDGKLVKSSQTNDNEAVIDFSGLESGIYMLRITSDKDVVTKRIIKE